MNLPVIDITSQAGGHFNCVACDDLVDVLHKTSAVIIRDPRVTRDDNERYLDMMERYFDRPTEEVRTDLLAQEGVGPETADSILLYAGGHAVFLVDAYTVRIGQRIGLFDADDYEAVQRHFEERVPHDRATYQEYHALLVAHAKALCRPTPVCGSCPLRDICQVGRRRTRHR